ncbi:MAG: hypothetical protein ACD_9C00344G0003 [uncultured bacterium]|nr:MAG: hypothetical protein ACD_9C00344G0003 [uncultured bacterium]
MFTIDSRGKLTVVSMFILATLLPGILFFFVLGKAAFYGMDFWKLFSVSFAVTIPIFSLNYVSKFLTLSEKNRIKYKESDKDRYKKNKKQLIKRSFINSSFSTGFIFYFVVLVSYLFEMGQHNAVILVLILELLYLLLNVTFKNIKKVFFQDI